MLNDTDTNSNKTAGPTVADGTGGIAQTPTIRRKSQPTARRALPESISVLDRNSFSENVVVDIVSDTDESDDDSNKDSRDLYEVEKILETKMENGVQLFRVRWKGFGAKEDTWEPREALEEGASELFQVFLEAEQEKENAGTARRGRSSTKRTSGGPSQMKDPSARVQTAKRSRTTTVLATTTTEEANEHVSQLFFMATPPNASPGPAADSVAMPSAKRSSVTTSPEKTVTLSDILKPASAVINKIPLGVANCSDPQETPWYTKRAAGATPTAKTPATIQPKTNALVVTPTAAIANKPKHDPEEVANMRARCATMKRFVDERGVQKDLYRFVLAHMKAGAPRKDGDEETRKLRRNAEALERFIEQCGLVGDFVDYAFAASDRNLVF